MTGSANPNLSKKLKSYKVAIIGALTFTVFTLTGNFSGVFGSWYDSVFRFYEAMLFALVLKLTWMSKFENYFLGKPTFYSNAVVSLVDGLVVFFALFLVQFAFKLIKGGSHENRG